MLLNKPVLTFKSLFICGMEIVLYNYEIVWILRDIMKGQRMKVVI